MLMSSAGFEPTAPRLGIWCSIRLSYEDSAALLTRRRRRRKDRPWPFARANEPERRSRVFRELFL